MPSIHFCHHCRERTQLGAKNAKVLEPSTTFGTAISSQGIHPWVSTVFYEKRVLAACCSRCGNWYEFYVNDAAEFIVAREQKAQRTLSIFLFLSSLALALAAAKAFYGAHINPMQSGWLKIGYFLVVWICYPLLLSAFVSNSWPRFMPGPLASTLVPLLWTAIFALPTLALLSWVGPLIGESVESGTGEKTRQVLLALGTTLFLVFLTIKLKRLWSERLALMRICKAEQIRPQHPPRKNLQLVFGVLGFIGIGTSIVFLRRIGL